MVIDRVDDNGILHGGFGVQMVDPNLAGATNFDNSLKNIMYVNNDGEMYVSGVFLGNKLLKVNPTNDADLVWGDKKLVFKEQLDAVVASEASLQARVTALETAVLALQQQSSGGGEAPAQEYIPLPEGTEFGPPGQGPGQGEPI